MSALFQCHVWHGWRWVGISCIMLLIFAAVGIREAEHAQQVQHMARGLFSSINPSQRLKVWQAVMKCTGLQICEGEGRH